MKTSNGLHEDGRTQVRAGRRAVLSALALALAAGAGAGPFSRPAAAAVAAPDFAPPPRWTGAYVGVNAGGAAGVSALRTSVERPGVYFVPADINQIGDIGSLNAAPNGFVGGAQAGYNYQSGAVVYGLEADVNALPLSDQRSLTGPYISSPSNSFTVYQSVRTDWLITARPRVGLAIDNFLFYGTAGVAATKFKYDERFTDTFHPALATESFSETRVGWTVGAGAEYALREHWTIKGEYLYADFGKLSETSMLTSPAPPAYSDTFDHTATFNVHLVRLGLNYKF